MKTLFSVLSVMIFTSLAFPAEPTRQAGELQLSHYDKVIASPSFAQALSEANSKVNGKKIRIFYSNDRSSRMTSEALKVVVVGRIDEANGTTFQKAEFTATAGSSRNLVGSNKS